MSEAADWDEWRQKWAGRGKKKMPAEKSKCSRCSMAPVADADEFAQHCASCLAEIATEVEREFGVTKTVEGGGYVLEEPGILSGWLARQARFCDWLRAHGKAA